LNHRDQVIAAWQANHPGQDVFEERTLGITGFLHVSVDDWVRALQMQVNSTNGYIIKNQYSLID
jgi:hypothetical protein